MKKIVFLFFVLLTVLAYWPSLLHAPKHDQLGFLADMALRENAWAKTLGAFSWNRERLFMGADQFLFRPGLNLWLTAQLFTFGYNFSLWQGMGILLHILVGFSMFRLLDAIRPGVPAAAAAGCFLLMLSNLPMVVWTNVGAYMIFCALILESVIRWIRSQREITNKKHLRECVLWLLASVFFFEAGVVFCACFALTAVLTKRPNLERGIFLIPVFVYFAADGVDLLLRNSFVASEAGRIAAQTLSLKTALNMLIALKWFFSSGIFLKAGEIVPVERVAIAPYTLNWQWPWIVLGPHVLRGLAVLGLFIWGAVFSFSRLSPERRRLIVLLLLMMVSFVFFVCFGRVNTRGIITGLFFNSYYIYFFWILALPAGYAFLSLDAIRARPDGKLFRWLAYIVCGAFMLINSLSIYNVNSMIALTDRPRRMLLDQVSALVAAHRGEPGFSIYVPRDCPGNYAGKWLHKQADPLWRRYTLTEALYPEFYRDVDPKYVLHCSVEAANGR